MSIRYSSLQRPSRETGAIRRNTYSVASSTVPDATYSRRNPTDTAATEEEESTGLDTWSRLLVKLHYYIRQKEREAANVDNNNNKTEHNNNNSPMFPATEERVISQIIGDKVLPASQLLATLQVLISKQNEYIQVRRRGLLSQRLFEESERAKAGERLEMENTFSVKVWHETLAASREKWQKLVSATFDKYKSELIKGPHRGEDSADSKCGLPSTADLYDCLLEGVNADSTAEILQKYNQSHLIAGIEKTGLLTNFKPHVHIFSYYHNLVPSMKQLRRYFEDLAPEKLSCSSYDHLGASLEQFETQMDYFLRAGESVLSLRNNLLEGVHPSLRRLVYARALQIPLSVTDGTPLIPAQGDITNNHFSTASLAAYLSFATRYSRDKVHRRHQHHYSSSHHELNAKTLQRLVVNDVVEYIGDSDKYFVYEDEVKVLLQAMVADKSVPDSKIRDTLTQLGRPKDSLDSYAVYLLGREGDLIHQRAPPCGYIPVAGSSMTCGPLGNITGDTVEQYELLTAMNAQLWFRLQGPTPELLQCCIMFEEIIIQTALPASLHMRRTLKVSPLHLALEWFATGFAELLDPSELLSLWDIVLAYHVQEMSERCCLSQTVGLISLTDDDEGTSSTPCALWVLSLLAAAVFTFRAPIIEKCTTKAEIKSLFATGSQLLVRPLLQYLLFGCELEQ